MKIMIVGCGLSGLAVADFLSCKGVEYFFVKQEDIDASFFDDKYLENVFFNVSQIILSPGISPRIKLIQEARKRKILVIGEFEFGCSNLSNDFITVTGTNGKTTTVSIIYFLLKGFAGGVSLGGNIGVPVTSLAQTVSLSEIVVLEASSFQIETIKNFHPHIAVIMNITEDHLNRHKTMCEYIRCKYRITKNQTTNDYLLLNADDEVLRKSPPKTKANIFYFSTKRKVCGSYIKNGYIYFNDNKKEIRLVSLSNLKLKGEHNLSNVLAACLAVFLQTGNRDLFKTLSHFEGVPHRIEFVKNIAGVEFYNDSKATNIASTLVASAAFLQRVNLILGGSDKGYDFDELFKKLPKNVKNIAVFGQTRNKIAFSAKKFNYQNLYICDNLESATKKMFEISNSGEVVLLSPACASFDFFSNFEERGNFFKKIVREIELNESS